MDPERFSGSPSGRVVKVGSGVAQYWAFLPNPLPPPVVPDNKLACALSSADRAIGKLDGLGQRLPNPHLLAGAFVRREAVLSSRIEGTQAEVRDVYAYEAHQAALFPEDGAPGDVREVLNYVRALEYGLERVKSLPVSLRLIRELHEQLTRGVRGQGATPGEYRRTQNWIGRPGGLLNDADFVPPPVDEMKEALASLEFYVYEENELPPLVRVALLHYQFEAIHPFLDGNGRIGRLLVSLLLVEWGLLSLPLLYLSAYFEKHRDQYYGLLLAVSERGAWRDWLSFFLQGVAEQSHEAIARAQRLIDLRDQLRQRVTHARSSTLLLTLVDELFKTPLLTVPQAQSILGVSYQAARGNVEKLVESGVLTQVKRRLRCFFVAEEILSVVE